MPLIESRDEWQRNLFDAAGRAHANESDLRHAIFAVLHAYAVEVVGMDEASIRHEGTSASGRFDSLYGNTLIEYKAPGELETRTKQRKHAAQALRYLADEQIGATVVILTDGRMWGVLRDQNLEADQPTLDFPGALDLQPDEHFQWRPNSTSTAGRVLDLFDTYHYDSVTPTSLMNRLGPTTAAGRRTIASLARVLEARRDGDRTDILFRQWIGLAGVSYGINSDQEQWPSSRNLILGALAGVLPAIGYAGTIYVLHTYIALCSKMMAGEALALTRGNPEARPSQWTSLSATAFRQQIVALESGSLTAELRAPGLFGGDLFGWYSDELSDSELTAAIRDLFSSFSQLAWARLTHATRVTGDLLRDFYTRVIPRGLRKALGEFFTPQWLAERVVEKAFELSEKSQEDRVRYLDPTCGSGTFLVAAMQRALLSARRRGLTGADAIADAIDCVSGFDINPVAPLMARVNLLLTVGELADALPAISFHVYQADSILIPEDLAGEVRLDQAESAVSVPLVIGNISLPESLATLPAISAFARIMDASIQRGRPTETFLRRLTAEFPAMGVSPDQSQIALIAAERIYESLCDLHERKLDGVWAHVIEQSFAPRVLRPVDIVVGNPPWISWKNLPSVWRDRSESTWSRWGLWQTKARGGGTPMGDISSLLLARCVATYAPEGIIALLVPEGLLLNEPGGRAIRRCRLRDVTGQTTQQFRPLHVDDFTTLKPFSDAANKTIALYIRAGQQPVFPIEQVVWTRAVARSILPSEASLRSVAPLLQQSVSTLAPIDGSDIASRWRPPVMDGALRVMAKRGTGYVWGQGFHTRGADGIFYCEILSDAPMAGGQVRIRTRPDLGRNTKAIASREYNVEARFLWPLLRGADIDPFSIRESNLYCIVPHDPHKLTDVLTVNEMLAQAPNLYDYLEIHQDRLVNRSAYDMKLSPEQPWGIQGLAWRYMSRDVTYVASRYMTPDKRPPAGVVRPIEDTRLGFATTRYPNNKVNFVACTSLAEADFVAAFLNAPFIQAEIARLVSSTTIGPSVLSALPIPQFNASLELHMELRLLGQECRLAPHGWTALAETSGALVKRVMEN